MGFTLFGRNEPEKIALDGLEPLLDTLFEKKLGQFSVRAGTITRNIKEAMQEFGKACDALEILDATPYTEDLYNASITSIKMQKGLYTKALRRIVGEAALQTGSDATSYERYKTLLSNIEKTTNEILKVNAGFRLVMYGYSNHMANFKKYFSAIERLRGELRREIENRSKESSEYLDLKENITMLNLHIEELNLINKRIESIGQRQNNKEGTAEKEKLLSEMLAKKRRELEEINRERSRHSERISLLTVPLDRPSKKLDHLSFHKRKLNSFITDPIGNIRSEEDHREFKLLLNQLKEGVEKGSIETKNKEGTLHSISILMDSDLPSLIASLNSTRKAQAEIEREIEKLEREIEELKKGRAASIKELEDVKEMKETASKLSTSISSTKSAIESMFLTYYNKRVSLIL